MHNMPKFMFFRHKLMYVIAIFRFDIDVQKPNLPDMIHVSGDLGLGEI